MRDEIHPEHLSIFPGEDSVIAYWKAKARFWEGSYRVLDAECERKRKTRRARRTNKVIEGSKTE